MNLYVKAIVAVVILTVGAMLCPRPHADISPGRVLTQALSVNRESPSAPIARIYCELHKGCKPILEGSDAISGRDVWAIRLKIPPPKRYPWLEVWVDKKNSAILAWKVWGRRSGCVTTLAKSPN